MSGVTVTAVNPQTGFARGDTTDSRGVYRLIGLPVGDYEVKAEREGFGSSKASAEVDVAQTASLDFTLSVAGVTESVSVTAAASLVNPTASSVGQVIDLRRVS